MNDYYSVAGSVISSRGRVGQNGGVHDWTLAESIAELTIQNAEY